MHKNEDGYLRMYLYGEFVQKLETDDGFAEKWGDLGQGSYSWAWRAFPYNEINRGDGFLSLEEKGFDQIQNIVTKLEKEPDSRRIILSAWHPYWAEKAILPPCHLMAMFGTELLTWTERNDIYTENGKIQASFNEAALDSFGVPKRRLNCHLICRSQDFMLGTAFNVPMYALLTELLAYCTGMIAGDLVWSASSIHVYSNQKEQAKEILAREPKKLPRLKIKEGAPKNIFEITMEHLEVVDYDPHPAIKIPLSVG
jgi:thymidylate synthase